MNKNYLQLDFGSGQFFDYSSTEKEGYEKHVSTKGNTSFRKQYTEGVRGILEEVSIYDGKFGKSISMKVVDGDETYYLPVEISDQRGNVATYAESLIRILPHLEKGQEVEVRGYNFTPEGESYAKIGISIKVGGVKIKPTMTNSYYKGSTLMAGDIPAIQWKENALGQRKPTASSLEEKDNYLLEVLKVQTDRLKWVKSADAPAPAKGTSKELPKVAPKDAFDTSKSFATDEHDDLPF